jgi:hypothetical protein
MPQTIASVDVLQQYIQGVMARAEHHANNVDEVALAIAGAVVWRKEGEIEVMTREGDMKNGSGSASTATATPCRTTTNKGPSRSARGTRRARCSPRSRTPTRPARSKSSSAGCKSSTELVGRVHATKSHYQVRWGSR